MFFCQRMGENYEWHYPRNAGRISGLDVIEYGNARVMC